MVSFGIPQRGHLSSLLFILFMNDISRSFRYRKFILFVDDMKLYMLILSIEDCKKLQHDLNLFYNWCVNYGFSINYIKRFEILFMSI